MSDIAKRIAVIRKRIVAQLNSLGYKCSRAEKDWQYPVIEMIGGHEVSMKAYASLTVEQSRWRREIKDSDLIVRIKWGATRDTWQEYKQAYDVFDVDKVVERIVEHVTDLTVKKVEEEEIEERNVRQHGICNAIAHASEIVGHKRIKVTPMFRDQGYQVRFRDLSDAEVKDVLKAVRGVLPDY